MNTLYLKLILLLQLTVFIVNLLFALVVWLRSSKSFLKILYSSFSLSLAFWNLSLFLTILGVWPQIIWGRLAFSFGVVMATALFYFSYSFPDGKRMKKIFEYPFLLIAFILFLFTLTDKMVKTIEVSGGYISGELGSVVGLFTVYEMVLFFSTLVIITIKYFKSSGVLKKQIFYVMIGQWFFILTFLTTNLFLPIFFGIFDFNNLGPIFSFVMVFLIAYSIIKHNLLDIRLVIQRSLIYSILLSVTISFYLGLIFILNIFLESYANVKSIIATIFTIVLGIYGVPYLERYFRRITDKFFYKDRYNFSEALNSLSEILNKNIKLENLVESFSLRLNNILKTEKVIVVLLEESLIFDDEGVFRKISSDTDLASIKSIVDIDKTVISLNEIQDFISTLKNKKLLASIKHGLQSIKKFDIDFFVKISANKKIIGYILLGKKKSGDIFNTEDRMLLQTLSLQAGVAIEKARLYKKVQEYSRDLEKKVKRRTAKIEGLQKEQKQMMLEIAHRLQTPLTILKGDLGILQKELKNNKNLSKFENSVNKLSKFIYDILKLARLENNAETLEMKKINLSQTVYELGEYFQVVMKEKGINLAVFVEKDINIKGNADKIEELITNLVSNSAKYIGDEKNKKIELTLKRISNKKACLNVIDNGIGIEKEDLSSLFTNFYRSKNINNTSIEGTGLGLVISKKIADVHRAKIKVESALGEGTKIDIEFKII